MTYYKGRADEYTDHEKLLHTLGFWHIGGFEGSVEGTGIDEVMKTYAVEETINLIPPITITHQFRDVFKGLLQGHFMGPNPLRQVEKRFTCSICSVSQWVAINSHWTSHVGGTIYSHPYRSPEGEVIRPGNIDPESGWKVSQIDLLAGKLEYCPNHAYQVEFVDREISERIVRVLPKVNGAR